VTPSPESGEGLLNVDLLPDNTCFGCGHDNARGLQIEIRRDPDSADRLIGMLHTDEHLAGFPGITHGGALYTALDCVAAWVPKVLRSDAKAIWILRSARITYHRPAPAGLPVRLSGEIASEAGPAAPMVIQCQARGESGALLAEGEFKVVPLTPEKFIAVAGIDTLPPNWAALFSLP
jgi:acyl-CoA thioesterase FadM